MREMEIRIIAGSCGEKHLHALSDVPGIYSEQRRLAGLAKQKASHAVRDIVPGAVWCAGGAFKRIRDLGHFKNSYDYIRTRQEPGTIVVVAQG